MLSEYQVICRELNQEMEHPVVPEQLADWSIIEDASQELCSVVVSGEQVAITCQSKIQFSRMLGIAAGHLGTKYELTEQEHFEQLSFMLD